MNEVGLLLLTAGLVLGAARLPLAPAFGTLLGTILLVPATLVVPNGVTPALTVTRVVLWAFAARVVVAAVQGDRRPGEAGAGPVTVGVGVFAAVALLLGVVAAPPTTVAWSAALRWLAVLDQLVLLTVALVAVRRLGVRRVLSLLAGVATAMVTVAAFERLTGASWGAFLFSGVPEQFTEAARELAVRDGRVRVRVGFEFPLQFGWVAVALTPAMVMVATRRWSHWWTAVPAVVLPLAVYWSVTRTAAAALVPVLIVAALLARDRRTAVVVGTVVAVVAVAVLVTPGLIDPLRPAADLGAIDVRAERLPAILGLAATNPLVGLGFGGLQTFGFPTTDSSFLLMYAELGVIGLSSFLVAAVVAFVAVGRGLRAGGETRTVTGAILASCVALLVSAFAFDTFATQSSAHLFWLLAAVGIVAAEDAVGPLRFPALGRTRLALPVAALVLGTVIAFAVPVRHTQAFLVETLPTATAATGRGDPLDQGETVAMTACGLAQDQRVPAQVRCALVPRTAGALHLRIEADRASAVSAASRDVVRHLRSTLRAPHLHAVAASPPSSGRPTPAATAPVWLTLLAAGVAVLSPPIDREHRRPAGGVPGVGHRPVEATA